MKERPILFIGEMVRAVLEGRKTMTRRVLSNIPPAQDFSPIPYPDFTKWAWMRPGKNHLDIEYSERFKCPYGQPGDRLWVRETWVKVDDMNGDEQTHYRADGEDIPGPWKPSIFMPRWASRITLEIVSVRVERLREITEEDAKKEGAHLAVWHELKNGDGEDVSGLPGYPDQRAAYKNGFANIWDSINGKKHPWESNPWVWVIEFKKL
jgi:hypothetical protein